MLSVFLRSRGKLRLAVSSCLCHHMERICWRIKPTEREELKRRRGVVVKAEEEREVDKITVFAFLNTALPEVRHPWVSH